jgi:4-carboxymuconolactone decarboxylase
MDDEARHAQGTKVRRAVLSDAHVDRANASANDFSRDWQDFITRTAWGDVWSRPGIDRRMRSTIVLSITIALRHWDEFRLHLAAALRNGLTRDEIKEILIQSAIYAGVPAANHAFKEAASVFAEMDAKS